MEQLAFYNDGCGPSSGPGFLIRRGLRKLLLPMFRRLVEIIGCLCHRLEMVEQGAEDLNTRMDDLRRRQEEMAGKLPATLAFGWDYVAMVRRLAILEEQVDTLLAARDLAEADPIRLPIAAGQEPEPFARVG